MSTATLISVKCIWEHAEHNALTDLIFYKDQFFCCFRESDQHAGGSDGSIRILASKDANKWHDVAHLIKKGTDLRDPTFSETPDGRLLLTMGGSIYDAKGTLLACSPHAAFSANGTDWNHIIDLKMPNEWIWHVAWHKGIGYGASYHISDPTDLTKPWRLKLFSTKDGLHYTLHKQFRISKNPSETTLRFMADGTMVALVRRQGKGWIGSAKPPYKQWQWSECRYRLGGPNFLILPDGHMWAASRLHKVIEGKRKPHTALFEMDLKHLKPVLVFPSGGDTSYPGMVYRHHRLYVSYYSSHEGKAKIYLAEIALS